MAFQMTVQPILRTCRISRVLNYTDVEHGLAGDKLTKISDAVNDWSLCPSFRYGSSTGVDHLRIVRIRRKIMPALHPDVALYNCEPSSVALTMTDFSHRRLMVRRRAHNPGPTQSQRERKLHDCRSDDHGFVPPLHSFTLHYSKTRNHCSPMRAKPNRSVSSERAENSCKCAGSARQRRTIAAIAHGVTSGSSQPFLPSFTTSPQNFVATIGSFHAWASSCVRPKPSENVGNINMSASR